VTILVTIQIKVLESLWDDQAIPVGHSRVRD
jgi:hypothetical protein